MKLTLKRTVLAMVGAAAIMPLAANATNGYFANGYGTKNKGMAGAGVALPQDSLAAATNPAGMVWVGNRMDIGLALFSPRRKYTEDGNAAAGFILNSGQSSDSNYFLVPHLGRNWMLNSDSSFGVAVYGNGGMNTDYPAPGPFGAPSNASSGVDLMQLFIAPTYARKINATSSWGVSPILAVQGFKAKGLGNFKPFSTDSSKMTDNGQDISYGAGLRLGWQGAVSPDVTLGASYTSKIMMSKLKDYAGLFANGGEFDIPAQLTVGLAWKTAPSSTLSFDVQHIWYSQVDSIGNSLKNLTGCPAYGGSDPQSCFGGSNGPGFGWKDMTIYKLGYQWQSSPTWTWRAGMSYGKQPIRETTLNVLAPAVMETHLTGGFTVKTGSSSEFNFAAMYAPSKKVSGTSAVGQPDALTLEMKQFEVEASWGWTF